MSVSDQKRFLSKLSAELEVSSDDYRVETANYEHTIFAVTRRGIRKGVRDRLSKNFPGITQRHVNSILKGADSQVKGLIRNTKTGIDALIKRDASVKIVKYTSSSLIVDLPAGTNRYNQCAETYNQQYQSVAKALSNSIREVLKDTSIEDIPASQFWNLEHANLKGITETQIRAAINTALEGEEKISEGTFKAWMQSQGLDLLLIRDSSSKIMELSLRSQRGNAITGGKVGQQRRKLQKALTAALEKLNQPGAQPLAELGGSDSFLELEEKTLRKNVLDAFKKVTNATVVAGEDLKKQISDTSSKEKIPKNTRVRKKRRKNIRVSRVAKRKATSNNMLRMITMINKRLPDTVRKNMQPPALENRSGRFADSVRVTEVAQTPRGFPSVGYTYQRRPYEVFEMGSPGPWSSPERDPRKLIDKSIREIAARMAIGRFYTRRV